MEKKEIALDLETTESALDDIMRNIGNMAIDASTIQWLNETYIKISRLK